VPLFGDFPLLGYLFRFKSVRSKTNLLVFLTPRVIKEPRKITELTADRKKKMDAFVEQNEGEVEGAHPL
jgi:general secretion pathway protein D